MKNCYKYYRQLRKEMSRWLSQSILMDGPGRHGGGEDEANYALTWFPHYLITADKMIAERFRSLLADLENWVKTEGFHGYEPKAEAHHGTEPFLLFLPRYLGLFPDDKIARSLLEDAAHHIGNWIDEIPDWYDYEKGCFYSYKIGTRVVGQGGRYAYETAEHFRFIHIALAAYRVLGDDRYLEWSLQYGKRRAQLILDADEERMPVLWDTNGNGLYASDLTTGEQKRMAANGHHVPGDPLAGTENLLASGAIYVLGDLFLLSGDEIFRQAARKIVRPLIDELLDPYADPGAAAVGYYRWTFKDDSLDSMIEKILRRIPPESDAKLAMIFPQERRRRESGVGKRNDMVYWGLWSDGMSPAVSSNNISGNCSAWIAKSKPLVAGAELGFQIEPIQEPSTATLTLAYQMTGKLDFVRRALKSAATKLMMARRVLRGGREHSDMGGAICSVAAGHGRNWGQGAVTGCYGPLLLGTREIQSRVTPMIEVKDDAGEIRLPEGILSLVSPPMKSNGEVVFFNGSETTVNFSWRKYRVEEKDWIDVTLGPDELKKFSIQFVVKKNKT